MVLFDWSEIEDKYKNEKRRNADMNNFSLLLKAIWSVVGKVLIWTIIITSGILAVLFGVDYLKNHEHISDIVFGIFMGVSILAIIIMLLVMIIWSVQEKYNKYVRQSNLPEKEYEISFSRAENYSVKVKGKTKRDAEDNLWKNVDELMSDSKNIKDVQYKLLKIKENNV
jgi:uncharacterized membrane protein